MCNVEIQQSECGEGWSWGQNWIISKISWTSFQITFLAKAAVTLVPTIAGLYILVVRRRGEVLVLDSGWMHLCLSPSPAQPSPAPMNEWLCSRTGQLACWGLLGWVMNIPPARGEGTVASTSQAQYWSCRSSSISDELGLWIFTLEILWSNDQNQWSSMKALKWATTCPCPLPLRGSPWCPL